MLRGKLVTLRAVEESDLPLLHKWINDPEVTQQLLVYLPIPLKNEQEWFERIRKQQDSVHFAITDRKSGRLLGICSLEGIHPADQKATFGIFLGDRRSWGKGYGTEAARLPLAYGFDTLNLHWVSSSAFAYNDRSLRMHERLGFKREGVAREDVYRKGRYRDRVLFGLLRAKFKRSNRLS